MAKTSRDAWKHFRAWSDFFGAIEDAVSAEAFEEFIRFRKERKYLRQSFRRLIARGFVKKKSGGWRLTHEGAQFFRRFRKVSLRQTVEEWDGKWRLVSFDVPVEYNTDRAALRALLLEFDFVPLQKSVWVSRYAPEEGFVRLMADRGLWTYCKMMVVDILEGDRELRSRFKLPPR